MKSDDDFTSTVLSPGEANHSLGVLPYPAHSSFEQDLPAREIFAPGLSQATRLHSQHPLQRVNRRLANLSHPREVEVLALLHEIDEL